MKCYRWDNLTKQQVLMGHNMVTYGTYALLMGHIRYLWDISVTKLDIQIDRYRQMDGQMDGWTDIWTYRQIDRQIQKDRPRDR